MKNLILNRNLFGLFILVLISKNSYSQVEITRESTDDEKKEEKLSELDGNTEVFFLANWSNCSRNLLINEGLFAEPLGERENEESLNTWSFGLGFRNQFLKKMYWEGGISYLRNGESYLFEESDTMYNYQTRYAYISMPVKVYYTMGNDFKFYFGGGLIPQLFSSYQQNIKYRTTQNSEVQEEIKTFNGINSFVLSIALNAGMQVKLGNKWSVFLFPEYRYQLNSTYSTTEPYKHYNRAIGLNMGLTLQL